MYNVFVGHVKHTHDLSSTLLILSLVFWGTCEQIAWIFLINCRCLHFI